jgi:DNA-binding response OmpR family regulator
MSFPAPAVPTGLRILVADEDPDIVAFVMQTLRNDGHALFHAVDGLSAVQLAFALDQCHLVISNTRVGGVAGLQLISQLRHQQPTLPILYLANSGRSTPEIETGLPPNVRILREPFTADELRAAVSAVLEGEANGGSNG